MFEITGDDVAELNDEDLRTLVGRLCEAELRRRQLSPAAVTWGGSQTAKDGGLDVRVELPAGADIEGFIPKRNTGFQVKKPDMPRGEIIEEMNPSRRVSCARSSPIWRRPPALTSSSVQWDQRRIQRSRAAEKRWPRQ
jgi:hypothetical protein